MYTNCIFYIIYSVNISKGEDSFIDSYFREANKICLICYSVKYSKIIRAKAKYDFCDYHTDILVPIFT